MTQFQTEATNYQQSRMSFWEKIGDNHGSLFSRYYHRLLEHNFQYLIPTGSKVLEVGCGNGDLLASLKPSNGIGIDFSISAVEGAQKRHTHLNFICADAHLFILEGMDFDYIILSDLVNDLWDVQEVFTKILPCCKPHTRIILNFYSNLWNFPLKLAQLVGVAKPSLSQNWLTKDDLSNLLNITGFESLHSWQEILCPVPIPVISPLLNRYLAKIYPFNHLCLTNFLIARPKPHPIQANSSVSIVIAARNESGHIHELLERIPVLTKAPVETEIIFVEGNSSDDTFETIERVIKESPDRNCQLIKQTGKGKGDAVRAGFAIAKGDILMILDADITVPPEDLPRFYELMVNGSAEFVNGVRLVYPMNENAMRFFNLIGNKFFSFAFSWLLGQPIKDTLCGTKVLWRNDYKRIAHNRAYFGDFDPFGDFDLLFGAAKLNLKIMEIPIRYRARRYGETNISRWSHGLLLLRMVIFAARRLKFHPQ